MLKNIAMGKDKEYLEAEFEALKELENYNQRTKGTI
jgi:hypothetical protein